MKISLVVAAAENNAIGKDNQLLWNLPNDMKFFKNTTWGLPVIMGRKTFESFGKPLAGRTNIIITRKKDWEPEGTIVVNSLEAAVTEAMETGAKEICIIGGGEIYKQAMDNIANRIIITRVHTVIEGDTYFPEINEKEWRLVTNQDNAADEKHAYAYSFQVWERSSDPK